MFLGLNVNCEIVQHTVFENESISCSQLLYLLSFAEHDCSILKGLRRCQVVCGFENVQVLRSLATRSQRASAMRSGFVKFGFVVGDEGRPQKHSLRMLGCGLSLANSI